MESFYYFINIFYTFVYAFVLDNFRFFEPANEKIHSQIHLTSFIEFTMILNQTKKHLKLIKSLLKILAKVLEKNLRKSYIFK